MALLKGAFFSIGPDSVCAAGAAQCSLSPLCPRRLATWSASFTFHNLIFIVALYPFGSFRCPFGSRLVFGLSDDIHSARWRMIIIMLQNNLSIGIKPSHAMPNFLWPAPKATGQKIGLLSGFLVFTFFFSLSFWFFPHFKKLLSPVSSMAQALSYRLICPNLCRPNSFGGECAFGMA